MDATLTPDKMWELAAVKARWDDFEPAFVLIDQLSETQIQLPEHRKQDLKKIEEHASVGSTGLTSSSTYQPSSDNSNRKED